MTDSKYALALRILDYSWLTVHIRTDDPRVIIPKHLARSKTVALQVGYNMPKRIPDLIVSSERLSGTLLFGGVEFWCCVPWAAVYAMADTRGHGEVWPKDGPKAAVQLVSSNKDVKTTPAIGVLRRVV